MNATGEGQSFDIRLTSDHLRRDAQTAINQFNRLSQQAVRQGQRIDTQFNQTGNVISNSFKQGVGSAKSALADLGKSIVGISALMASGSFIKDIYSSVSQFNREMKIVSTISEDVSNNLEKYKEQVLGLTSQIAIAPETAAQALYQINSAGHLGAEGMKVLEASAKAAIGGVTETATAADAITTILNAYKMKSEEATAVSDKLFTTVRLGKTTMDELGRSIAYVAPLAATYKISIDEVLAAVAQLTKQGNSTQNAMTQISAAIQAVANEMGDDAFKNGLLPALEEIEKRSNGSNMALKAQLSNIRALRGALGLTKENAAETAQMTEEIRNSTGAAEKAFKTMNSTAGAELTKLKNNFIKEFSEMATSGAGLMGNLAKALNSAFDTGHMQEFLRILGLIIAAYGINKGILMAMSAIENSNKISMLNAEYAAWMQILPAKEANNHADVEAAIAAGTLTEAKGAEIIALREELAQKIATAKATQAAAKAELAAAEEAVAASQAKVAAAQAALEAKRAELTASGEICGAYISENAVKEISIATTNAETASETALTAAKRLEAAQTRVNAANKELETLEHQKATVAQASETASTGALAAAKRALTAVTAKLNAVIAANPYTLVAAAVIALGVAIYKLCTYESQATKQAKALQNATAKITAEYVTEEGKLQRLNQTLKTTKKGSDEWLRAKKSILDQYGKYHNGLQAEIDKVGYLKDSYDELTKAIKRSILARQMQTYAEENMPDTSKLIGEILNAYSDKPLIPNWDRKPGEDAFVHLETSQQNREDFADKLTRFVMGEDVKFSKAQESFLNWKGGLLEHNLYYNQLRAKRGEMKTYQDNAAILQKTWGDLGFGVPDQEDTKLQKDTEGNIIQDKAYWEKQRDDAQRSLEAMKSTELTSREALELKKKITEANAEIAKYDTKSKKGGTGKTTAERQSETEQAQRDQLDLLDRQARERARAEQDAQFQVDQAIIDAMEDGAEKRLKQKQLEYDKEKAALQREMEDAILTEIEYQRAVFDAQEDVNEKLAAEKGKKYAKRVFNPGGLMTTQTADGQSAYNADKLLEDATIGNVSTETINQILSQYQTLFQSLDEIRTRETRQAETDAMNEYLIQWGRGLEKRNALIAAADRAISQAETEGERLSIAAQLQRDLSNLEIEANKKTSAITLLFDDLSNKSIKDLEKLYEKGKKTLEFLQAGEWDAETGLELGIASETYAELTRTPEELERITKALRDLKKQIDETKGGFSLIGQGLREIFKAGNDAKKFQDALGKITSGMQQVLQAANFLTDSLATLGDALGSNALSSIAEGFSVVTDALDSAMQGAQAGAVFGPIGAAAGAALGVVTSLVSAFSKLHDAKYEKRIERLQDQIDTLQDSYDALGKAVDKAYSTDAAKLIGQQQTMLKQQQALIRQQIVEEESKKNSDSDRIKEWKKQLKEIDDQLKDLEEQAADAIYGEDIKSAIENFASAYDGMFDNGITKAKASKDIVKSMIKQMILEALKMDISAPMEKLRQMMMNFWADGYISQWEQEQLNAYAEGIMGDLQKKYGWADSYFNQATNQSSSKGGFTTMSQDSADELNGRFTALQMSNETIKNSVLEIQADLKNALARIVVMSAGVEEIRGMALIAIDYLETICKHTANLPTMNERLEKIEKYTSRL